MEKPESVEQFASLMREAGERGKAIRLAGASTKAAMAGPEPETDCGITTTSLKRVVQYDPKDLTISVEAGLPFRELAGVLAEHRQMLPLDPPFFDGATVGGVVASNCSGPRRRVYGTARDMIIGMKFITLEGKVVQSGGMVVKNVAGLDMAKLMVGSFGTLAAIAVVNFKVVPMPAETRTFAMEFETASELFAARDSILKGVLQPLAIDALNPAGARRIGLDGYLLLLEAGGSPAVLDRYQKELPGARVVDSPWARIREFVPEFLRERPNGVVVRTPSTLSGMKAAFEAGATLARAANGISYQCFDDVEQFEGKDGVVEFAPHARKRELTLWPNPGSDFAMMEKVKEMFDPGRILNPGRLYGRI